MENKTDFKSICRFCMGTDTLNPIFHHKKNVKECSMVIYLTTGIKIDLNDGLPQNICKTCISFINQSIKFRLLCKETANKLLNIKTKINRKTNKEKDSIKINPVIEHCDVLLSDDSSLESNINDKSDFNFENSEFNIFDGNFIKIDTVLSEDIDFAEELNENIKTESTDNDNHFQNYNQVSYNEDNQYEVKIFHNELKTNDNEELYYSHNETDCKDNYNLNNLNDGIPYHQDTNNAILYGEESNNVKKYNQYSYVNEESYEDNEILHNNNETYDEISYNSNTTKKAKSNNNNKSNKEKSYNEKSYIDNNESHNELSYKTASRFKYMIITKNNRVICKICNKNLALRSFDAHIWNTHPGVDERKILCSLCNEYIVTNRMKTHIAKHGNHFTCVYCKHTQENKELLTDHTASCPQKMKKRKPCETSKELKECDVCHKIMQKGSLRLHKEVKHAGLGPICEHCNKKFSNKFRLMEHLRAKHGYDKFKCKLCEFETASEISLKNHERRHAGIRPYLCERCGAKFHAAYLLVQHRNSHTTDKIFKCEQCPASFKTNNGLHMHRMTCHSNKTLSCSICARAYKCRHYLVKHMRGVHRYSGPIPCSEEG